MYQESDDELPPVKKFGLFKSVFIIVFVLLFFAVSAIGGAWFAVQ